MNIEKLVADRELCEQIPVDEFLDAAFCWHFTEVAGFVCGSGCEQFSGKQWQLERSSSSKIVRARQRGELIFPAPTLEEIMVAFPADYGNCPWFCMYSDGYWSIGCEERDLYVKNGTENSSPTVSGLKLWLEVKGIEA